MNDSAAAASATSTAWTPKLRGFKVYALDQLGAKRPRFGRRDYFKVLLLTTRGRLDYGPRHWELDGTYLLFFSPHVRYSLAVLGDLCQGYISFFTEEFIASLEPLEGQPQLLLFDMGRPPFFQLPEARVPFLRNIFQKMLVEQQADYPFKAELIRLCLQFAVHEALHQQPANTLLPPLGAAARLTARFWTCSSSHSRWRAPRGRSP